MAINRVKKRSDRCERLSRGAPQKSTETILGSPMSVEICGNSEIFPRKKKSGSCQLSASLAYTLARKISSSQRCFEAMATRPSGRKFDQNKSWSVLSWCRFCDFVSQDRMRNVKSGGGCLAHWFCLLHPLLTHFQRQLLKSHPSIRMAVRACRVRNSIKLTAKQFYCYLWRWFQEAKHYLYRTDLGLFYRCAQCRAGDWRISRKGWERVGRGQTALNPGRENPKKILMSSQHKGNWNAGKLQLKFECCRAINFLSIFIRSKKNFLRCKPNSLWDKISFFSKKLPKL